VAGPRLQDASFLKRAFALAIDAVVLALAFVALSMLVWFAAPDLFTFPIQITESVVLDEEVSVEGEATVRTQTLRVTYFGSEDALGTCDFRVVITETPDGDATRASWTKELAGPCPYLERVDLGTLMKLLLFLVYAPVMEGRWQATVGKLMLGLRVRRVHGGHVTFPRAFARNLAEVLCILTLGLGYLIALFTKRRQALHDLLSGTVVVSR
jgi:uncharacterized RDD family membrane protein YckC